ncbi:MAG: Fic family protein [Tannerella sp.]|jgi:Fic family protein|nr:Fic family protein [Tannerella sp.]
MKRGKQEIATAGTDITERTVKEIHALILHGINREQAGQYRNMPVMIVGSRHTPPQPYLIAPRMEQFIRDYNSLQNKGNSGTGMESG